ncbi:nucleotide exchange factor GrpE [Candidatus Gracilibacteria bacterium]|nr:nucleotide exchange factor GrpE [Thermales bacterium]NJL96332.1 nucleotide exchange factor GrpE [Candidatus Gracilibacteria bacterium]
MANKKSKKSEKKKPTATPLEKVKKTKTKLVYKNMQPNNIKDFQAQKGLEKHIQDLSQQIASSEVAIASKTREIEDWKDKSLRLAAELQNNQKQQELDIAQTRKRIKKQTVDSIFSFLNTLQISFNYKPITDDQKVIGFIKTLEVSFDQVLKELSGLGIEIIKVQVGDEFDPEFMTILSDTRENDSKAIIKQVVSVGLKIDDQIIQPAGVML